MKTRLAIAFLVALALVGAPESRADLVPSADGTLVYDTDLDITWLADADYARTSGATGSVLNWPSAVLWAANLGFAGHTEWRLPRTDVGDSGCSNAPASATGEGCSASEMGHLFYVELQGVVGENIATHGNAQVALFDNLDGVGHWSETEVAGSPQAYLFRFGDGLQNVTNNTGPQGLRSWAVHPGNITGVEPVPALPTTALVALAILSAGILATRVRMEHE